MTGESDYSNLGSIPLTPPPQYYQHLALNIQPEHLEGSQYVFAGDEKKKRSLSEIMFFGIGSSYITGLAAGGLWGLIEHTRTFDASSQLLRRNHCLNSITKRGTFVGNSLGVLALFYTASAGCIGKLRDKDDLWNDIGAGAVTGGLYKSTKGIATFSKFVGIGAIGGLLLNLANGTFEEGTSYASDTISETYEDLFERR